MKLTSYLFPFLLLAMSCSENKTQDTQKQKTKESASLNETAEIEQRDMEVDQSQFNDYPIDTIKGLYIGKFGKDYIHIALTYANMKRALGYNIHKGLQRNLNGTLKQTTDSVFLDLSEPGDNKYDGVFQFAISKKTFTAKGIWTPRVTSLTAKSFTLKKRIVKLRKDDDYSIDEDNFGEMFSYCYTESGEGDFEFNDDGSVEFTRSVQKTYNSELEVLEKLKGTWTFTGKNKIQISWPVNKILKERTMNFTLVTPKAADDYQIYIESKYYKIRPMYY